MQTTWPGFGIPSAAVDTGVVLTPQALRVTLADTPGLVTVVSLSAVTVAVNLYTNSSSLWYAIDTDPGPIPPPTPALLVPMTAFQPGAILEPGIWHQHPVPLDHLPHTLHLVSEDSFVIVAIVMLEDGT